MGLVLACKLFRNAAIATYSPTFSLSVFIYSRTFADAKKIVYILIIKI